MASRFKVLFCAQLVAGGLVAIGFAACDYGPVFAVPPSTDGGGLGDGAIDVLDDLPPLVCTHCTDPPAAGPDAADGRSDAPSEAASVDDATMASDVRDATLESGEGDSSAEAGGGDADSGACPAAEVACDGGCVPSDVNHCGTCANDCTNLPHVSGAVTCTAGQCSLPASSCASGWGDCNGSPTDGCETDLTQPTHCGSCGTVCSAATPVCTASDAGEVCASGCPAASPTLCNGTCVDTASSMGNCAACGNACTTSVAHAQAACAGSACTIACNAGYTLCNGACVDELTDGSNCGGCGATHVCAGGTTCQGGSCKCPAGTHDCSGTCQSNTSLNSCGAACNVACPGPTNGSSYGSATCNGTSCGVSCNSGYTLCGSSCVDEQSDSNHCGGCGTVCVGGTTCVSGSCVCNTTSCPNGCCSGNTCGARPTWYQDADGDGYGNGSVPIAACAKPTGYVADIGDCCDADGNAHPGSTYCASSKRACGDNWDYNCDGASDAVTCSGDPGTVTQYPMDCQNQGEMIACAFDANNNCLGTCSGSSTPNAACASACNWLESAGCGVLETAASLICAVQGPNNCAPLGPMNQGPAQACN